jgi:hypothetical protein
MGDLKYFCQVSVEVKLVEKCLSKYFDFVLLGRLGEKMGEINAEAPECIHSP